MHILSLIINTKCKYRNSCPHFQKEGKYCEGLDYCKCGIFLKRKRGIWTFSAFTLEILDISRYSESLLLPVTSS